MWKFEPILKQTLWGGERIIPFKHLHSDLKNVGESWEVSGVKGSESVFADGEYKGRTITDVLKELKGALVGAENYKRFGDEFPLLIKFIDACQDLSIQVHPNDGLAEKRHNSRGKTEMWYVVDASEGAHLRSGLSKAITPEEYEQRVADSTITDVLQDYPIHPGDVFFLPAGRIHSIGAGAFIAEIQETSDITYRIFDFNRKDAQGHTRQLHTELAKDAIDYNVYPDYRTHYTPHKDERTELVSCPYFTTNLFQQDKPCTLDYRSLDSCVILMGVKGKCSLESEGKTVTLQAGETVLLPATATTVQVTPDGECSFLEIYIK